MSDVEALANLIALGLDETKDLSSWSQDYQDEMRECAEVIIAAGWRPPLPKDADDEWRLEDWVDAKLAHTRINRSQRTIARWVSAGLIRTARPGSVRWLNVPDLVRVESEKAISKPRKARPPKKI